MRIVLMGPPGAGKGTQSQWLAERLGVPHLSTGDLLRAASDSGGPLGGKVGQHLAAGRLVPDTIVLDIVRQRLEQPDCQRGCLFDGFPRTLSQAQALDSLLAQQQAPLDLVLQLDVDEARLIERLANRGRADDSPEIVRQRLDVYQRETAPLLEYYQGRGLVRTINGNGPPEEVSARIKAVLEGAGCHEH